VTRYAVIGDPVSHSKSPLIHSLFAEQTGEQVEYEKIGVTASDLATFIRDFFAAGGGGLNVTLPHKESVFALAEHASDRARLARAANTLWIGENQSLQADNTDGAGLVRDLKHNLGVTMQDKSVLILGAGGSARGVLPSIIEEKPATVTILNRTLNRAKQIQQDFSSLYPLNIGPLEISPAIGFDIVINATSSSIADKLPPLQPGIISAGCSCYDLMYSDQPTPFMQWAVNHGAELVVDGLGMLVEQAAESFLIWRGVRPDTQRVIAALR
jgi:shikimate dehydrogenase